MCVGQCCQSESHSLESERTVLKLQAELDRVQGMYDPYTQYSRVFLF